MATNCSSVVLNDLWDQNLSDELFLVPTVYDKNTNQVSRINEYSSEQDLLDFVEGQQNHRTTAKTCREARRFIEFVKEQGIDDDNQTLQPRTLNPLIGNFLKDLKNPKTGKPYEPDTITSYHRSIAIYLRNNGYPYDIVKDTEFALSKRTLHAKRTEVKKQGIGHREHAAEALTVEEENTLWEEGLMGWDTPISVVRALWFLTTKLMGFRGSDETRKMKWGDLFLQQDQHGEYLEFCERHTKTRTGSSGETRDIVPKAYENPKNVKRCPVVLYREYVRHRPNSFKRPEIPFYLAMKYPTEVWTDEKNGTNVPLLGKITLTIS